MALLFQSNPEEWDLRRYLIPGNETAWYVTRYQALMYPGALALLWEAQGRQPRPVRGLYGWGITTGGLKRDASGRLRIPLTYVERWVLKEDRDLPDEQHMAAIPAAAVLGLPSWSDHLLNKMSIGTNFLVSPGQLDELARALVQSKFPGSQFAAAVRLDLEEKSLDPASFQFRKIHEGEG
jgi:hypothetical protein